ncbi:hypothetical protein LCGC14_1994680 [marine sediment metagenome]|uniref:Uncharacterized protein n=1 Tax=marine sediment metagenome TaxID=412755 RepID=A0A0F9F4U3_9ZZZZ
MLEDYANVFNERKLYLRFSGLMQAFIESFKGSKIKGNVAKRGTLFNHYYSEFRYHLYCAYYFLGQLDLLENTIIKQYNELKPFIEFQNEVKIEYDSFIVHEYLLRIMPFLNTLFILQDRLMVVIGLFLNMEFQDPVRKPNESNKVYNKKVKNFRSKLQSFASYATNYSDILKPFPKEVQELVVNYWNQNGQEIRQYRNLNQHQFNLLEEAYIVREPTERFILYLPDNPNERNFENLTYDKNRVAIDYFKSEIQKFHDIIEEIMEVLGVTPERHEFATSTSPNANKIKDYNEGDLMKIWVIKNEAILFSVGEKTPNGEAAKLALRKIKNKIVGLKWDIK